MHRLKAKRAMSRGHGPTVVPDQEAAIATFRDLGLPFWSAVALLELGESLAAGRRVDAAIPVLAEARAIFGRLQATPWLERLQLVYPASAVVGPEAAPEALTVDAGR
jgi:hypothetical protein